MITNLQAATTVTRYRRRLPASAIAIPVWLALGAAVAWVCG